MDTNQSRSKPARNRWAPAVRHLRRVDPHLRAIIDRIGPCRLEPHPDRFGALVRSIIGQQISSKAAASINQRLVAIGGDPHQPSRLLELGEANLRTVGLSGAKARYVLNLAEAVDFGQVPLDAFDSWDDAAITKSLTSIKGIGIWTAEMFLIFALNRPDILPVGDLGVRVGLRDRHGLAQLPAPRECHALAELWRPYRTIASWYIWKGADTPIKRPASTMEQSR
jgi:DNA-3-methyladenine glycosylase II